LAKLMIAMLCASVVPATLEVGWGPTHDMREAWSVRKKLLEASRNRSPTIAVGRWSVRQRRVAQEQLAADEVIQRRAGGDQEQGRQRGRVVSQSVQRDEAARVRPPLNVQECEQRDQTPDGRQAPQPQIEHAVRRSRADVATYTVKV
jgi:hypothetical protein